MKKLKKKTQQQKYSLPLSKYTEFVRHYILDLPCEEKNNHDKFQMKTSSTMTRNKTIMTRLSHPFPSKTCSYEKLKIL